MDLVLFPGQNHKISQPYVFELASQTKTFVVSLFAGNFQINYRPAQELLVIS